MKNYSNPYQAPVLKMSDVDGSIVDTYDERVEKGFRALFAGTDGWYEIYKTKDGIIYKNKIGSGGSSGGGSGEGASEAWVIDNFYNKTEIDGKIEQLGENINTITPSNTFFSLDPKFPAYYFDISLLEGTDYISLKPNERGEWFLYFLSSYYDYTIPYDIQVNILIGGNNEKVHTITISNQTPTVYYFNYFGDNNYSFKNISPININLDNYYTKEEIDNKGYLIEIPSEYITQTELDDKGYVKTSDIPTKVSELENDAQYLNSLEQSIEDIVALSGFYYTFEANHVYKVKIDSLQEKVQFYFSTPPDDEIVNQILIYLDNTTLGDSQPFLWSYENISPEFINGEEPTIGKARYRILAEYNPYSENWVIGVVPDGAVQE